MGFRGTYVLIAMFFLSGCLIDDPPPCTIKDDVAPEAECVPQAPEILFKVEYTTANGTIPAGRYSYTASGGLNNSQSETECKHVLQYVFNTDPAYVALEMAEVQYYRGNICGTGFRVKNQAGEIKVKRTRKISASNYDYDLEFICTNY